MVNLFQERSINELFDSTLKKVNSRINDVEDGEIIQLELIDIAKNITSRFIIRELDVDFDSRSSEVVMVNIPGSYFPITFFADKNKSYPCAKVNYTFTVSSNNTDLLTVRPNSSSLEYSIRAEIGNNWFTIGVQTQYANTNLSKEVTENVKNQMRKTLSTLKEEIAALNKEIKTFNDNLEGKILNILEQKRQALVIRNKLNDDLNQL